MIHDPSAIKQPYITYHPTLPFLYTYPGQYIYPPIQIKKNTAPHELKPSDILIDRFTAWKQIVKMLIGEFSRRGGLEMEVVGRN